MGTERGGCSRLMKTPRHNGGAVHSRSMRAKKKDNHCSGRPCDKSRGGRCDKKRELDEKEVEESHDHSEAFFKCKAYIKHGDIVLSGDERIFDYDFE